MKQKPTYLPHVACPSCGFLSVIDYTTIGQEYTWWCGNDECGKQYKWIQNENGSIDAEPTGITVRKNSVLLKLEPQKETIFLTVKGTKDTRDNEEYYYNEHACPVSFLQNAEELFLGKREDPHGLFQYVRSIDR